MRLFRIELKRTWREAATIPALAAAAVLLIVGVFGGQTASERLDKQGRFLMAKDAEKFANTRARFESLETGREKLPPGEDDPRTTSVFSLYSGSRQAVLPPAPLAPLSIGQSDLLNGVARLNLLNRAQFWEGRNYFSQDIENPLNLQVGGFDAAFVMVYLLPLLALALGFGIVAGDRDRGILPLVLSQTTGLAHLALSRAAARLLLLWGVSASSLGIGLFLAGVSVAKFPGEFGLTLFLLLAYLAFWMSLSIWVNGLGRSAVYNATVLAGAWLTLVLVLPSVMGTLLGILAPPPSRVNLAVAARDVGNRINAGGDKVLERFYLEPGHDIPDFKQFFNKYFAVQKLTDRELNTLVDAHESELRRRQTLQLRMAFLSPALVLQEGLNDIAGTGIARHNRFEDQALVYQARMKELLEPKIFKQELVTVSDLDALPAFEFREESVLSMGRRILPGAALLSILALGFALGGMRRLKVMGLEA
ncbi:DUF3526 domain-containing protein [bacterium]|nr:DUF3526 domain-containing protein [bacterium]